MLSNTDIEDLIYKLKIPYFNGCISKYLLPTKLKKGSYVLNMENDRDEHGKLNMGTHWIACYVSRNNTPIYWDSFGFPPALVIEKYLKKTKKRIAYSNKEIQNINSEISD